MLSKLSDFGVAWLGWIIFALLLVLSGCGDSETHADQPASPQAPVLAHGSACFKDQDCVGGACFQMLRNSTTQRVVVATGGYCSAECTTEADCGADATCIGASTALAKGQCMARCAATTQCRMGYQCIDGAGMRLDGPHNLPKADAAGSCQVIATVNKLTGDVVGRMCESDQDCGEGFCSTVDAVFRSYPGGYCTGNCVEESDCGDVGTCAKSIPGAPGACFRKCQIDADCGRSDYRCRRNVTGDGLQCQPAVKPLADGVSGKPCASDVACGGAANSCAMHSTGPDPVGFPGGYCTQTCAGDVDCGAGGVCAPDFAVIAMGTCYQGCVSAADCRDGYDCRVAPQSSSGWRDPGMRGSGPLVCAPVVPASDLDAGM